jgi:hypothetical protein
LTYSTPDWTSERRGERHSFSDHHKKSSLLTVTAAPPAQVDEGATPVEPGDPPGAEREAVQAHGLVVPDEIPAVAGRDQQDTPAVDDPLPGAGRDQMSARPILHRDETGGRPASM